MDIGLHLRHLKRLWGLPTVGDRLESLAAALPDELVRIEQKQDRLETKQDDFGLIQSELLSLREELPDILDRVNCINQAAQDIAARLGRAELDRQDIAARQSLAELQRQDIAAVLAQVHATAEVLEQLSRDQRVSICDLAPQLRDVTEQVGRLQSTIVSDFRSQLVAELQVRLGVGADEWSVMTPERAAFLNVENGHRGHRGQLGLWLNEPITFQYADGSVTWNTTNERIAEVPFVFQALLGLSPHARILDVGACESLLPLHLASLGYRVTALDIRHYPFSHPRLDVVRGSIVNWCADESALYDAVSILSTVEHIGLPAYENGDVSFDGDKRAMSNICRLLKPGGTLALTTLFGQESRTEFQRTYSSEGLRELLVGFEVRRCGVVARLDEKTWTTRWDIEFDDLKYIESGGDKVVLIEAERAGEADASV